MYLPILSKPVSRNRYRKLTNIALVNPSDNGYDDDAGDNEDEGGGYDDEGAGDDGE